MRPGAVRTSSSQPPSDPAGTQVSRFATTVRCRFRQTSGLSVMAPPKLILRFALFSGLALVAAVGIALLVARWNANDRARSSAVGDATAVARQFANDDLSRSAFRWPRPAG